MDRAGNSSFIDVIDVCPGIQDKYRAIDYDKVREAGFKGVIIQCSLYSSTPNLGFERNADAASRAGLAVGSYHFASCASDPIQQAEFYLRRLKNFGLRPGDIPPCMDLEYAVQTLKKEGPAYVVEWGSLFMNRLCNEMHHLHLQSRPMWYTYPNFASGLPLEGSVLAGFQLWLARYHANKGPQAAWYPPDGWEPDLVPKGCQKPILCQYSGTGGLPVPGVVGDCDRNVFFGSQGDWDAFRGLVRPVHTSTYTVKD